MLLCCIFFFCFYFFGGHQFDFQRVKIAPTLMSFKWIGAKPNQISSTDLLLSISHPFLAISFAFAHSLSLAFFLLCAYTFQDLIGFRWLVKIIHREMSVRFHDFNFQFKLAHQKHKQIVWYTSIAKIKTAKEQIKDGKRPKHRK